MPFLSVLIPVYNGERYLGSAIESALNQPCKDLEIIVANDGSTDNSLAIARQYADKDDRIRVVSHENVGRGKRETRLSPTLMANGPSSLIATTRFCPIFIRNSSSPSLSTVLKKRSRPLFRAGCAAHPILRRRIWNTSPLMRCLNLQATPHGGSTTSSQPSCTLLPCLNGST